jgi:gliding motility-associated-like protein
LRIEFGQADLPELTAISNDIAANFVWSATPNDTLLTPLNNGNARIVVNPQSDTYYYVTATDMKGCTASDRVQITVNATRRVFVANAFTPNNDNRNDILFVQGGAGTVKVKSFEVFNRWGELVFASKDTAPNVPAYGWNGIYKDEVVDPAVFIWVAVIEFADGQILTYKGDTTVLK